MGKNVVSKLLEKGSLESSRPIPRLMGVDDANFEADLCSRNSNWFGEIGVVADDHRGIATLLESVEEQIGRDIDIGALLFCLPNSDGSRTIGWGIHKRHPSGPGYKMSLVDFNEGEGTKSSEKGVLAGSLLRIVGAGSDPRGEIADFGDLVFRKETPTQSFKVEPLVRSVFNGPVVEVEAVYVDDGGHPRMIPTVICHQRCM